MSLYFFVSILQLWMIACFQDPLRVSVQVLFFVFNISLEVLVTNHLHRPKIVNHIYLTLQNMLPVTTPFFTIVSLFLE